MAELPSGTVTLLFTDIEGSTRLLERLGERYAEALATHQHLLRASFAAHGGQEIDTQGDAFFVAFPRALAALQATVAAQRALAAHPWSEGTEVRVRMGLHTGEPLATGERYVGLDVHRAARVASAGHGGQVLLTQTTHDLVERSLPAGVTLRDLGAHRLKDLAHPERLFQLVIDGLPADFPPLKTLDRRPHNLPVQPTPLIGRAQEIAAIGALLRPPTVRLVTLTGPGGTGKTRLGLQVAAEVADEFADGVFFVPLAPLSDPTLVASTIATTLGLTEPTGQPLEESLTAYLRDKQLLLLLDNFEQVLEAAVLIGDLVAACPALTLLVTSQAALRLSGEHEVAVSPLALPDLRQLPALEHLSRYPAVQLFIERAQAVRPDFQFTTTNAPAVVAICHRLDGLPLALELAAARVRVLPPQAILARLERRLTLLAGGTRDLPARQQTLRATLDWSHALLTAGEQRLFARLAIFVGGWTLTAAEAVCNPDGALPFEVLDGVESLVAKSLVRQDESATQGVGPPGEPRFAMLGTIREYALERLAASGEAEVIARRHATYYLTLLRDSTATLRGPSQLDALVALGTEIEQIRAAWRWAVANAESVGIAEAADSLFHFYDMRSWFTEGAEAFGVASQALATRQAEPGLSQEDRDRAALAQGKILARQGWFTFHLGRRAEAKALLEQSLAILRALDARAELVFALNYLAAVCSYRGEYQQTRILCEESLELAAALGDLYGRAIACNILGQTAYEQSDYAAAKAWSQQSLALELQIGNRWSMAFSLTNLGKVAYALGDYGEARRLFERSLQTREETRDTRGIAICLNHLGDTAVALGESSEAWERYTQSLALFREIGNQWGMTSALINLGRLALAQGHSAAATRIFQEALRLAMDTEAVPQVATVCAAFVPLLRRRGESAWATELAQLAATRPPAIAAYQPHLARLLAWSWDENGTAPPAVARQLMTLEQAIQAIADAPEMRSANGA